MPFALRLPIFLSLDFRIKILIIKILTMQTIKLINQKYSFLLLCLFISLSLSAQDPCSINAGTDINLCETETDFTLIGLAGNQIEPSSIQWINPNPDIFEISQANSLQTVVDIIMQPPPIGCYEFLISADCLNGTQQVDEVIICFGSAPTQANITVNGVPEDQTVVCNTAFLDGNFNLLDNETGCWYVLFNDVDVTLDIDFNCVSNSMSATVRNRRFQPCKTYRFYYQVTNGFCITTDSIDVTFLGQNQNIGISGCADTLCTSEICYEFKGTNIGCHLDESNIEWTVTAPGYVESVSVNQFDTRAIICMPSDADYIVTYTVDDGPICGGGTASCSFTKCSSESIALEPDINVLYCDEIPSTLTFSDPTFYPWTIQVWPQSLDNPMVSAPNGSNVTISGIDPETTGIVLTQTVASTNCPSCSSERKITISRGPDLEINDASLEYLCGAVFDWNPWDYVTNSGGSGTTRMEVLAAPPTSQNLTAGQIYFGSNLSLQLVGLGEYKFSLSLSKTENGVTCKDEVILCVNVCDAGNPAAPTISDLCIDDEVQLFGSLPDDACANILWTQISGPAITFINGTTENDMNPWITVSTIGTICLEYSFSTDPECYLADTSCFEVFSCCDDEPELSFNCENNEYCLLIDGIAAEDNAEYIVCAGEICSSDYSPGDIVIFTVCTTETVNHCAKIDDDACCYEIPVVVPECCEISTPPDVELVCDTNGLVCLFINEVSAADFAEFLVCGDDLCLPLSAVGDTVNYLICDWQFGSNCMEIDSSCCWEFEFEVPLCCQVDTLQAEMLCDTNGLVCLYVNGERAADFAEFSICGDDLCVAPSLAGETVNYKICEWGFETFCYDDEPYCCTDFSLVVPLCCQVDTISAEMICDDNGLMCLYVNGNPAYDFAEFSICGSPLCVPQPDGEEVTLNYKICEWGLGTSCEDEEALCCTEVTFELDDCCPEDPIVTIECEEDESCIYINGIKASLNPDFQVWQDECFPFNWGGGNVEITVFYTNNPDCSDVFLREIPICDDDCEINLTIECIKGKPCLHINGIPAKQQTDIYTIYGPGLCLNPFYAGTTQNYEVILTENQNCRERSPVYVPDCSEGEGGGGEGGGFYFNEPNYPDKLGSSLEDIVVFPNPASDNLYIKQNSKDKITYKVFDLHGKLLSEGQLHNSHGITISIEQLTPGVHFIEFENLTTQTTRVEKFLKQ